MTFRPGPAAALAAALACQLGPPPAGAVGPAPEPPLPGAVQALVDQAERTLARGDATSAEALFEQAAARWHAAPIEAGWVRAQMQAGDYGRALAFAAHVAGAHADEPVGTLLYAQLLALGAQQDQARRLVKEGLRRWPEEPGLRLLGARLAGGQEGTEALPGPYATGDAPPADAVVVSSAVLWSPNTAVVPAAAVQERVPLWLRDGLGRTRLAGQRRWLPVPGVWVVKLAVPLDGVLPPHVVQDAFPGSPAFASTYRRGDGSAQWPQLVVGFLGTPLDDTRRRLGFEPPDGEGGPVFDAGGRLVGVVSNAGNGAAYLPAGQLAAALDDEALLHSVGIRAGSTALVAAEAVYTAALRVTLQCLVPAR